VISTFTINNTDYNKIKYCTNFITLSNLNLSKLQAYIVGQYCLLVASSTVSRIDHNWRFTYIDIKVIFELYSKIFSFQQFQMIVDFLKQITTKRLSLNQQHNRTPYKSTYWTWNLRIERVHGLGVCSVCECVPALTGIYYSNPSWHCSHHRWPYRSQSVADKLDNPPGSLYPLADRGQLPARPAAWAWA